MTEAASLAISAFDAVCRERDEAKAEIKRLTELLDAIDAIGSIKRAHWHLMSLLKPGDEKTKAVIEELQKFL